MLGTKITNGTIQLSLFTLSQLIHWISSALGNTDDGNDIINSPPQIGEEGRSIGVAFYLILNSQNKNPYKDIYLLRTKLKATLTLLL